MAIELAADHGPGEGTALGDVLRAGALFDPATTPPQDAVTTALVEVTTTNAKMTELAQAARDLAAQYKDVVADVTTGKGYDQIAAIRTELRSTARYPMQDLQKAGSKMLGTMQRQFNERATALIEEVKALEKPFQDQLDAEDTRKANEKAERDRIEAERIQRHVGALAIITGVTTSASSLDAAGIKELIDQVTELSITEEWEEFRGQAQQARDEALRQLNGLHVAAVAEEQERAELAAERQRQAAFRAQQEAQAAELQRQQRALAEGQAALARQQQELDAQRAQQERAQAERKQAVQWRIEQFANTVVECEGKASQYIADTIHELTLKTITAADYDDRVAEALTVRATAIRSLQDMQNGASEREAEEARQREADRIQVNINNLAAYGDWAPDAGSQFFIDRTHALNEEPLDAATYGDRLEEAKTIQARIFAAIGKELIAARDREQEAAAEAERQRQEIEANAAKVARMTRLQDAAPRVYACMKDLYEEAAAGDGIAAPVLHTYLSLVKEIEGDN